MHRLSLPGKGVAAPVLFIAIISLAGCRFDASGSKSLADFVGAFAPITEISRSGGQTVLHAPGQLYVFHGFDCANSRLPQVVRVQKTIELPTDEYTNALVYLNGWKLRFHTEESQIIGLGAAIAQTKRQGRKLMWEAVGGIGGEDADQWIEFCYYYTVIAWTNSLSKAVVQEEDLAAIEEYKTPATHSALLLVSRYLQNPAFEPLEFVGVLPKGFGFLWGDYDEDYFLQAAYHLGPSERYIYGNTRYESHAYKPEPKLPSPSGSSGVVDVVNKGFISWNSSAILKNGDDPDPFIFGDLVAGVGGDNFGMIDPHFGISPRIQVNLAKQDPMTQEYTVSNIPFHFAAPVLKGWDLHLLVDDEQVREIGIWIDSFRYERNGKTGTLTYNLSYTYSDDEDSAIVANPLVAIFGVKQVWPD